MLLSSRATVYGDMLMCGEGEMWEGVGEVWDGVAIQVPAKKHNIATK